MSKVNCSGITSGFIKVAGDFVDDYQEFRKEAAKIIVDIVIPDLAGSKEALDKLIDSAIDLQTKLFKSYGVAVGEGKGKIGPRCLIIPTKKVTGSLKTEREFHFALCPFDKVTVTIKKTDGKGGADIAACVKYPSGEHFNEKRKSISKGKDSKGESVKFVFADMAEKVLTLRLVQTGFVTDVCHYSVSAEGEFNNDAMRILNKNSASKSRATTQRAVRPV
jgi:hypothetical protein